jgi:hypothetical protein
MDKGFTKELMRVTGGQLKTEFRVEPTIPLEIKLWVERLRLAELIRGSAAHSPSVCSKPAEGFHCKRRDGEQNEGAQLHTDQYGSYGEQWVTPGLGQIIATEKEYPPCEA